MPLNAFRPTSPTDRFSRTKRYELTLLVCAIAWLITETLYGKIATANLAMIFLLAVLVVAVNLGRNPAIFAVVLCVSAFDFLYVPPRFSFAINDFQYLITLVVMLVTAIVTAHLAASLREKAHDAQRREANTYALYDLTRELAGAATWAEAQAQVTSFLQRQLGAQSLMLRADADGEFGAIAEGSALRIDRILARVVMKSHEFVRDVEDRGAGFATAYLPLGAPSAMVGVLALRFDDHPVDDDAADEALALARTTASLVSVVLDRIQFAEAAQAAEVENQTERLRNSILSALSHDVRTPLTAMVGLADSLFLNKPPLPASALETAQALREQAERLSAMVSNLLEMARLRAGEVQLRLEWQPVEEVIGASLKLMGASLVKHPVKLSLAQDLPLVNIDAVLIERVLCNLLDNAAKYSPEGTVIDLAARRVDHAVEISVTDRGSGFKSSNPADLFRMFVRGRSESSAVGTGLGLAICKSIIDAHGGTIFAEDCAGAGGRVRFTIPLGAPPTIEEEVA